MRQSVSQLAKHLEAQMKAAPGRNQELPLFKSFAPTFESMNEQLERIIKTQDEPVKVVLMGEVKAGKSTLINSMLKQCISSMKTSEATALIHQFTYSELPYGKVIYSSGKIEEGSVEEIQERVTAIQEQVIHQQQAADDKGEIQCVEFGLNNSLLRRFTLVDTPGIGTVTTTNEELTKHYIKEADIILWVFNSKYIGQSNIKEEVIQVIDMGKEVIGVLNRVDEVEMEADELIEEAEDYISYIDYRAVSAQKALDSILAGQIQSNGILELIETVDSYIGEEKRQAKEKLMAGQLNTLIDREVSLHEQMLRMTQSLMQQGQAQKNKIDNIHERISEKIYEKYLQWLKEDFLMKQLNVLNEVKHDKEKLLEWERTYLNEAWVGRYIERRGETLGEQVKNYWKTAADQLDEGLVNQMKAALGTSHMAEVDEEDAQINICKGIIQENNGKRNVPIKEEIVEGIGIGAILSGIVAVVGPAAAEVTFFAAATPIIPAVVGGKLILRHLENKRAEELSRLECAEIYKSLKEEAQEIREALLEEALKDNIFTSSSQKVADNLKAVLEEKLCLKYMDELKELEDKTNGYTAAMHQLKEQLNAVLDADSDEKEMLKEALEEAAGMEAADECLMDLLG